MPGFGAYNPFPFEFGGGPSSIEEILLALRALMGQREGGAIGPEGGIEDTWRLAESQAIDAATSLLELAVMQAFATETTVHLSLWEQSLSLPAKGTEEDRRQAIVARGQASARVDMPALAAALTKVNPSLSVVPANRTTSRVSMMGRAFAPQVPFDSAFGAQRSTRWPAHSDEDVMRVKYALGIGETTIPEATKRATTDLLNDALPSWMDFEITDAGTFAFDGFGGSIFDQTPMSP